MLHLFASLGALFVGPLLAAAAGARRRALVELLDGYVVAAVGGLVLAHLLPEAMAEVGGVAVLAAVVGFWLPVVIERRLFARGWVLGLALVGLAVHDMMDGAALVEHGGGHGHETLALGVILHRVAVGLVVWWAVRPRTGTAVALALMAGMAAATVVGYVFGGRITATLAPGPLAAFEALVAGSLLHVVLHESVAGTAGAGAPVQGRPRLWAAVGALAGLATAVTALVEPAAEGAHSVAGVLAAVALPAAPAILAGLAGLAALRALLGARSELAARVALRAVGPDALLVGWALLGAPLTGLYAAGALAAVAVAARRGRATGPAPEPMDVVDRTLPRLLAGLLIAALAAPLLSSGWLADLAPGLQIALLVLVAPAIRLPVAALMPLAAVLLAARAAPGAAVAFLIAVAVAGGDARALLAAAHGPRAARLAAGAALTLAAATGVGVELLGLRAPDPMGPGHAGVIEIASLAALGGLLLVALLRQGPRALVAQVTARPAG